MNHALLRKLGRACALLALLVMALPATAQQYRSEVKELDTPPPEKAQQDPRKLLQGTTDPYAKALLLRDLAAQAVDKKDFAQASKYLEQALSQNALSGIAADQMRKDLSQLYLASGDYKKIIPQLEAQVKSGKAPPELLVALGAAYVEGKRYKDAVPLLERALAANPKADPSWRRAMAAALMGAGRDKDALPYLEQLLQDDPSQRDDWLRLVALHSKFGNRERAAAVMEIASRLGYLQTADERLRLVNLIAQIGAPFEAASALQTWMERDLIPVNGNTARLRAALWLNARESGLALAALDDAIRLAPSVELYQQRAQLHMDREAYPQAAEALEQAIARGAKDGATFMALGMARYQQADIEGAIEVFREAGQQASTRKLAGEWVKYLESGKAREQAMAAAAERRSRDAETIRLSGRMTGEAMTLTAAGTDPAEAVSGPRDSLTPVGAEAPPNRDGSIPAWAGGLSRAQWPASFKPGGRVVDPYPDDKPQFVISAANAAQYRDRLSPGHRALLARYPSYRIPVYPSRRSVAYPQEIYGATQANIGKAKLLGSDALEGAHLGFPFPKPQSGVEVLWNHRTRYRGNSVVLQTTQAVVRPRFEPQYLKQTERVWFRYSNIKDPIDLAQKNILLYYLTWFGSSRNEVDFLALVHETANSVKDGRNIWVLPPKIRKMFRVPPVGYDQPFPGSEGLMFIDMVDMYNGAFDRYVWKLTGKRELYIPYNSYRISDGRYKYADLLKPDHFNQDATRYELHRVWVVEATERGGKRHSFGKRTFYVDEDSWNVVLVENEDHKGQMWRFQEGHLLQAYDALTANTAPVVLYDLKDGRYFVNRLSSEDPPPKYDEPMRENEFLPAAVKARYSR